MKDIFSIEQLAEKHWQINGRAGKWQYYGYDKEQAISLYYEEIEAMRTKKSKKKRSEVYGV